MPSEIQFCKKAPCAFWLIRSLRLLVFFALVTLSSGVMAQTSAAIYAYPLPSIYTNSSCYTLTVNGTNIPVVNYTPVYDYAEFSMSNGIANVRVTAPAQTNITSDNISPEKLGITGTSNGNTLSFTITNSQHLIISVNGLKPFALCADPMETNVPPSSGTGIFNVLVSPYNADNTGSTLTSAAIQNAINAASAYGGSHGQGIVYVPAGVYLCGNLHLTNNMALYLQGGSVIRCTGNQANYVTGDGYRGSFANVVPSGTVFLSASNGTNIKIYGRGTVDGNGTYMGLINNFGDNLLIPIYCTNFTADGITFRDAAGWGIVPSESTNVLFTNLKIFDNVSYAQDDCIDVVDSQNVIVSNVVGIAGDDTFSTKSYSYTITNVLFEDSLLWSQYVACKIGWEVYTPQEDITFSNIVVYNCQVGVGLTENKGGNSGGSNVQNLSFNNIDIQNTTMGNLGSQSWGEFELQTANGLATNILVANINVRQTGLNGSIGGIYNNAIVDGITFSNIYMPTNVLASNLFQMDIFNQQFYTNLTILPAQSALPAVYLTADDPGGTTSFNAAGNWSNDSPPASTNNYVDASFTLRTPTSNNSMFGGGPLSLYDSATLGLKNDNKTTTVGTAATNGLFLDNSTVKNVDTASDTLAGYVTLLTDGGIFRMPGGIGFTFTVSAVVGGVGAFQAGASGDSGAIKLSGANTYTGGTTFGTSLGGSLTLQLSGSGTLGSTNGSLTLNSNYDIVDLNGTAQGIGNLSGTAGTILNNAASTASTLTIGYGNNGGGIFSGNIENGMSALALVKTGSGTITLAGTNTYTGGTTINGGTMELGMANDATILPELLGTAGVTNNSILNLASSQGVVISNLVSGSGSLVVSSGDNVLTAKDTYTGATIINGGILALSGSSSISNTPDITIAGGAIFDVSGLSSTFGLAVGQTLSNSTSTAIFAGKANSNSGMFSLTYAAGTPSLMVTNGTLTLSAGTQFNVNNTGPALAAGSYLLISNDTVGTVGAVAGTAPPVAVNGNGLAGAATAALQIKTNGLFLAVTVIPSPAITKMSVSGTTLTVMATNGLADTAFVLLESTNLALPPAQWKPVLTNSFDGNGNLNLNTNILNPGNSLEFYMLQTP